MRSLRLIALAAALLPAMLSHAQNFNYSFSHSTSSYQPITGGTSIANGTTDWSGTNFTIPVGFSFQFDSLAFDSMIIESNGFVKFDQNRAVVLYHGAGCRKDSNNVYSTLSYSTTGTAGSRILKLQYAYCGYSPSDSSEYLSYQLWLYEQGNIEIHTGPTSYNDTIDSTYVGPTPLMGLINPLQDGTGTNALLLSGDPSSPSSIPLGNGQVLVYLQFVPPSDKVYTFTPNGN